jgi:hypothetical protein
MVCYTCVFMAHGALLMVAQVLFIKSDVRICVLMGGGWKHWKNQRRRRRSGHFRRQESVVESMGLAWALGATVGRRKACRNKRISECYMYILP